MKIIISNKKALHNYQIYDKYNVGISLWGCEVKSIINAQVDISQAFVVFRNNEAFLINMNVTPWKQSNINASDSNRTRKLLLHKNEILKIQNYIKKNKATLIPLNMHFEHNKIKLLIAIAKRKKIYDKRQDKKALDEQREIKKFI